MSTEISLLGKVKAFAKKHNIDCSEAIHQVDSIITDAYSFIDDLMKLAGVYDAERDPD